MKLEVGMYVRTKWGIAKIIDISKDFYETICYVDRCFQPIDETKCDKKDIIGEPSHNIIDLIEAGDYVNGSEVMEADWINEDGEYEEGLAFPMYASDDLDVIENWLPLKNVLIKSIVTKEQFSSMEYKVVE